MSTTDVLIFEDSLRRIAPTLARRCPGVRAVAWHADGSLSIDGEVVDAGTVKPVAGWISGDVLRAGVIRPLARALVDAGSIEWVQSVNAGLDHPVYGELAAAGVKLSKSGAQSIPIAEYVLAYALHHAQRIDERRAAQLSGTWKPHRFAELWHARWLIVGFGHIGGNVARRAKAFDSHVTVVRRTQCPHEHIDVIATPDALHDHLPDADFVVLACPATPQTRGMADARFFAAMKPGSLLVNIARGALVDEDALLVGLDAGRPGHAVLDVFNTEPLPPTSPLWKHPKVTVTAHISNAGHGTPARGDELFLSNLERFLSGQEPLDQVPPDAAGTA